MVQGVQKWFSCYKIKILCFCSFFSVNHEKTNFCKSIASMKTKKTLLQIRHNWCFKNVRSSNQASVSMCQTADFQQGKGRANTAVCVGVHKKLNYSIASNRETSSQHQRTRSVALQLLVLIRNYTHLGIPHIRPCRMPAVTCFHVHFLEEKNRDFRVPFWLGNFGKFQMMDVSFQGKVKLIAGVRNGSEILSDHIVFTPLSNNLSNAFDTISEQFRRHRAFGELCLP